MNRFSAKASALQWLDHFFGAPLCFGLTVFRRVAGLFGNSPPASPPRTILFIKLAEQGSTVLAHQAIRLAVNKVGRENVFFIVFEENRFILDLLGLIPEANVFTVRTRSPWTMMASGLARLREIRRRRFDACVDLEFFARFSAAFSFLTGARQRIGFHAYYGGGPYRGDLLTHRILYNPHHHTASAFATLVLALDADAALLPALNFTPPAAAEPPRFHPAVAEQAEARQILSRFGVAPGDRLVLLNANASDLLPLRKWDSANYLALAARLLQEFPRLRIAFTGAPEEAPRVAQLVAQLASPRVFCLAGQTTLRQLLIVYGFADVLVTNDSGPAHFAALTPLDVVVLFGPETPALFAAPSPRTKVLWAGLACSPCVSAYNNRQTACQNNLCLKTITVDQVFDSVCLPLRQRGAPLP